MAIYDPDSPIVIGSRFPPLVPRTENLDTGSSIGYTFTALGSGGQCPVWLRLLSTTPPPGVPTDQEIVCHLYRGDDPASAALPARRIVISAAAGFDDNGMSLGGGAASVYDALANPSDGKYVRLAGGVATFVDVKFSMGETLVWDAIGFDKHILDVTVLYAVSGPFAGQVSPVSFWLFESGEVVEYLMDSTISGSTAPGDIVTIGRSRLGELNPFWYYGIDPTTNSHRMPWVFQALDGTSPDSDRPGLYGFSYGFGSGTLNLRVYATGAGDFDLQYMALEVTYRPVGDLIGCGGLNLSSGVSKVGDTYVYTVPILAYPQLRNAATDAWLPELVAGERYTIVVGKAHAGADSLISSVPLPITGIDMLTNPPDLGGMRITRPVAVRSVPESEVRTFAPAMVWHAARVAEISPGAPIVGGDASPFLEGSIGDVNLSSEGHPYHTPFVATVSAGVPAFATAMVLDDTAATCVWASFYARRSDDTTADLTIYQSTDPAVDDPPVAIGPTGTLTVVAADAFAEIVDGWRLVTVALDPAVVFTAAGGALWFTFGSTTPGASPWEIAGAGADTFAPAGYGGEVAHTWIDNPTYGGSDELVDVDLTLFLTAELDQVTGLATTLATQALTVSTCPCDPLTPDVPGHATQPMVPTGISYVQLDWDPVPTGYGSGFGYYEVQRSDTSMAPGAWETIATIRDQATSLFDDYEARVGIVTSYRARMVHRNGVSGAWSTEATVTIPAPGVTGECVDTGLLIMTSDTDPLLNTAVVILGVGEEFEMVESAWTAIDPIYGRDYQLARWPTERGGVRFTRSCVVNTVCVPTASMDKGFTTLRDLAWARLPYVCVRDELGNRWLSNVTIPKGTVRRHDHGHQEIAEIVVTEVTATPATIDVEIVAS